MAGEAHEAVAHGFDLVPVVALLGAAVVAVPIFKRAGLGPVLGYLAAGLAIGPWGIGLFRDAQAILHVAELGVVLFLFVIGLEMQPSRLWGMRREIFGLGLAQVGVCMLLLWTVGLTLGYPLAPSLIAGTGFVLTSTAIVMQMLEDRGMMSLPPGRRIIAILLFEDLAIVPLLALVAFLAPGGAEATLGDRAFAILIGLACIAGLIAAGRWLLNPMFRILANAHARELLTAAALLVVLGAALAMQAGGLSMAMGAFLAGVMLSESTYRHQLEADVEPFRGILLGLFFMSVGMALDLRVVWDNIGLIVASVIPLIDPEDARHLRRGPHRQGVARRGARARGADGERRRVRLRPLCLRRRRRAADAGGERHPDRGHHHLDGGDAAPRHPARPAAAGADALDGRRRRGAGPDRRRADHRLRPRRPGGQPAAARPRLPRLDDRDRHRDDRGGRRLRLQGLLRRRRSPRYPPRRRRRRREPSSPSASRTAPPPPASSSCCGPSSRSSRSSSARSTASTRSSSSTSAPSIRCARPSSRRC